MLLTYSRRNSLLVKETFILRSLQRLSDLPVVRQTFVQPTIIHLFGTNIKVLNGNFPLVSVKTSSPVPKKYLLELGQITHQLEVEAPVEIGQVIANRLFGEEIELVATRQVKRKIS